MRLRVVPVCAKRYLWSYEKVEYTKGEVYISPLAIIGTKGIDGESGEDGYTPEKGVDYFTEEDIASLNIPTISLNGNKTTTPKFYAPTSALSTSDYKRYIIGASTATNISAVSSNENVYMKEGALYSENTKVATVTDLTTQATLYASGADYAECFEWEDGNPDNEDRRSLFVSIVHGTRKIRKAMTGDDILGITSIDASVVGNAAYKDDTAYSTVGMVGVIKVKDNGQCVVGDYVIPGDNGIAIPSTNDAGYKVTARHSEDMIEVLLAHDAEMISRIKDDIKTVENKIVDEIAVGPTQPTTNEKVWIQHSKNYFNKNDYFVDSEGYVGFNLNLELGKTYTMSSNKPLYVAKFANAGGSANNNIGPQKWGSFTSWTFVAGDNVNNYLNNTVFLGVKANTLSTNINDFADYNIQIEEGTEATEFEEFVDKKIYCLNDNNIYEKFLDVEKANNQQNYSTTEQVIGTWIDGKLLYRKTIKNTVPTSSANGTMSEKYLSINSSISFGFVESCFIKTTSGAIHPIPYVDSNGYTLRVMINENKVLRILNWVASLSGAEIYVNILYTKTTD